MPKTTKFNAMIEAFECDFVLAEEGKHKLADLDQGLAIKDKRFLEDIELLKELSWMLRNGKAEIHITEE